MWTWFGPYQLVTLQCAVPAIRWTSLGESGIVRGLAAAPLGESDLQEAVICLSLCLVEVDLVGEHELAVKRTDLSLSGLKAGLPGSRSSP